MALKTRIILLPGGGPDPGILGEIAAVLRLGGVMAFPTDTFYGLGANAFSAAAVERIYALKRRDRGKPLSIIVADPAQASRAARNLPPALENLARAFWPGPLTLVLRAAPVFPAEMLGPGGTIALRVPAVAWLRDLLRLTGFPITATSANLSGDGELDDCGAVRRLFDGRTDLIVDGGRTPGGAPSTIVDLTSGAPRLLRAGAVPWNLILAAL
ncbi:MAG: L-threonylcarbamoyladenylate synthase [Candidatus Aminicenantales bacterium]